MSQPSSSAIAPTLPGTGEAESEFRGSHRFEIRRMLGRGGMGVVYEAWDRERQSRVALKTLLHMNPESLLRFKREFRTLQDLQHRNLVRLGELHEEAGSWFFTMELIDGTDLLTYVRADARSQAAGPPESTPATLLPDPADDLSSVDTSSSLLGALAGDDTPHSAPIPPRPPSAPASFNEARLRAVLAQLVEALCILHAAHKVHRDLKPSNVMVTPAGRVVVLDFGIVTDLEEGSGFQDHRPAGTAAYMAPEQAVERAVTPAADFYAVGVMLYQILTDRLPFFGQGWAVLKQKECQEPPHPQLLGRSTIPADLGNLCAALIRRQPDARPTGLEILRCLVGETNLELETSIVDSAVLGRESELESLDRALRDSRISTVTVLVYGESGVGKSCLARQFLRSLGSGAHAPVILRGRCYEREAVPFKALDSLMDELSRFLTGLPPALRDALLPEEAALFGRLFPVLSDVKASGTAPSSRATIEPVEVRRRATAALRELLRRISENVALVLLIDDLQWSDVDSLVLLQQILAPPSSPRLLLLGTVRSSDSAPLDRERLERLAQLSGEARSIELARLSEEAAQALAYKRLAKLARRASAQQSADAEGRTEETPERLQALAAQIARESGGHPLFIDELARQRRKRSLPGTVKLDDALWQRIEQLDRDARQLLELLAVSGTPLRQDVAQQAAALSAEQFDTIVGQLRQARLIVTAGIKRRDVIATYHDRVRETVAGRISLELRRSWHGHLATSLEALAPTALEALAEHWRAAGQRQRAAGYAAQAAERAAAALAFEHAARLYRAALEASPDDTEQRGRWQDRLGEALRNAGRGAEAAEAFLQAAASTRVPREARSLKRRAVEQLLRSGRLTTGRELLQELLQELEIPQPSSRLGAFLHYSWLTLRIKLNILKSGVRRPSRPRPDAEALHEQMALCWTATLGLILHDPLIAFVHQQRYFLLALQSGDPKSIAVGLAATASAMAAQGGRSREESWEILRRAQALAEAAQDSYAIAFIIYITGFVQVISGNMTQGQQLLQRADSLFRSQCTGVAWELDNISIFLCYAQLHAGPVQEASVRAQRLIDDALVRGDQHALLYLRLMARPGCLLALDRPEELQKEISESLNQLRPPRYDPKFWQALSARAMAAHYLGQPEEALSLVEREIYGVEGRALFSRLEELRGSMNYCLGACALGVLRKRGAARGPARDAVDRAIKILTRTGSLRWTAYAALLQGALHALGGEPQHAAAQFAQSARQFADCGMYLYAAGAQARQGQLLGGATGNQLYTEAARQLRDAGIGHIERWLAILAPIPNS